MGRKLNRQADEHPAIAPSAPLNSEDGRLQGVPLHKSSELQRAKRAIAVSVLTILGLAVLMIASSPIWMGWMIRQSQKETFKAISKVNLGCGDDTIQEIQAWSKAGYMVSCRRNSVIDGPWEAWESGYMHIKGGFVDGKKNGAWLVYSRDGSLYRTIEYKDGVEISNVVHKPDEDT